MGAGFTEIMTLEGTIEFLQSTIRELTERLDEANERVAQLSRVEIVALRKLALICTALATSLPSSSQKEMLALTDVLVRVVNRFQTREGVS